MLPIHQQIHTSFFSPHIKSGEEYDYTYVVNGGHYNLSSFDKEAMFVLPPTPEVGTTIYFADGNASTKWFPVKIHRNGNLIMGEKEHMNCDVPNANFKLTYVGGYIGWQVSADLRFIPEGVL
jgi:hypothetical protein